MAETINATVYKEAIDTKVGLRVLAKDGKVYVTNLRLLFENSGKFDAWHLNTNNFTTG